MDVNFLLKGIDCNCGKPHLCNIKEVNIGKNAIESLTTICKNFKSPLIVADENTFKAAGTQTESALKGKDIKKAIFSGESVLIPNEQAVLFVEENLYNVDVIVGVGSGVIQDLCKYVAHQNHLPYLVVATAPSMDGYASNGAAMIMNGMKITYNSTLPIAIVADTLVLKNAPLDMIKAGYGDIIGKYSALNDWKLSHVINGEYFCQKIYDLTYSQIQNTLSLSDKLLERNEQAVKTLMEALVVVGILMSFVGSSRPASGSEHHLSHFFEITGIIDGTEYFSHGVDVAFSTVVTAEIREKIFTMRNFGAISSISTETRDSLLNKIYKDIAKSCLELQEKAGFYAFDRSKIYKDKKSEIISVLKEMPQKEEIINMLAAVELDINDFYSFYGQEKINNAKLFAKDLKDRFSILWLYYDFLGELNEQA